MTVRPIGPAVSWLCEIGMIPSCAMSPRVGFNPTMPLLPAGATTEPSVSVPTAIAVMFAAVATADPDDEPDGSESRTYGSRVNPPRPLQPLRNRPASATASGTKPRKLAHSDRFALPSTIAAGVAEAAGERGVARDPAADQRERSRGGLLAVVRGDVVLEQHGDPVEGPPDTAVPPFAIPPRGGVDGVAVGLDDRVEQRVQRLDPVEVGRRQLDAGQAPMAHQPLQLGDRGLEPRLVLVVAAVAATMRLDDRHGTSRGNGRTPEGGRGEERAAAQASGRRVHGASSVGHARWSRRLEAAVQVGGPRGSRGFRA